MFVPKTAVTSTGPLRNPRRRQRTGSDDSVKPPSAKRQRSALRNGDSGASSENQLGQHSSDESSEYPIHSTSDERAAFAVDSSSSPKAIPIRSIQKIEKEVNKLDATIVLSKTDFYTVSQLPTLPDQLRNSQPGPLTCFAGISLGYGLAMTNSHATIWPYAIAASSPSPADVFSVSIPDAHKDSAETVPLGVLLSAATNGIPGLMVIVPHSGKIVYWETVASAASLGLQRQKQTGIQAQINNLSYGEYATNLISCEPSGVLATFSTGRVAHITVRDPQGRPMVSVNFLRNTSNSRASSFLGGIKNALGSGFWKKDLAAIRASQSHQRGQRDVIIATSSGVIEIWDTHWNNGSILRKQFDIKNHLNQFFRVHDMAISEDSNIRILDFALRPVKNDTNCSPVEIPGACQILLVLALPESKHNSVSLVQVDLSEEVRIDFVTSIDLYSVSTGLDNIKPKLLVPHPGDTAFIMIGHSVILASLKHMKSPVAGSHLSINADEKPRVSYDSLTFRSGKGYEILGCCAEHQSTESSPPACLVMVRDFGLIRISAFPRPMTESTAESAGVSAKEKIEQAIFYGTMLGNPLSLNRKSDLAFPPIEIEQATLEICSEILHSTSRFVPTTAISMDQNLRSRAKALTDLASLLMELNLTVDRRTWWELLWGAEKLAAQRALWRWEENARKSKTSGPTFLSHVIGIMSDKFKTCIDKSGDDIDPVRSWLLYDTSRMEHIVPWIYNAIKPQKGQSTRQGRMMAEKIYEASELSLAVLETAFQYRDEHANQYGIGDGYLEDGVLITGYKDLPEFWTSKIISCVETGHLLDLELDSCRLWIQKPSSTVEAPEYQTIRRIARNCARKLQVLGQMYSERVRWLNAQEDPKLLEESITTEQALVKQRKWQLFKLAGIGQLEDAIAMAEKFRDMGALVELIIELQDQTKSRNVQQTLPGNTFAVAAPGSESEDLSRKISLYFEKFGESWADAFFSRQISMGQPGVLFAMTKFQTFVTRFLHKYPAYSRLGWINDVLGEHNFDVAARSLENLAIEQESDIWSHRAQLSFSKLAKLASWEEDNCTDNPALHHDIRRLEDLAEIDAVQEVIHAYIAPVLQGAIDHKAEIDLAMGHFGKSTAEDRPSLHEILREALTRIVSRQVVGVERLVDFLTLMDSTGDTELDQSEFAGKEFYLALRAIRLSPYGQRDPLYNAALQKLVWRRCMLKDNWSVTGQAVQEVDREFESFLYNSTLFRTLDLCLKDRQNEDNNVSLFVPTSPRDVSLTESHLDHLVSRFPLEQRSRIGRDLERENENLTQSIESGKLEFWFNHLVAFAENAGPTMNTTSIENGSNNHQGQIEQSSPRSPESVGEKSRISWL
ncbi:putative nuclear pore complex subunit Nup133 [Aspergillus affinis]|uniref:putative nuclear pore complex subunit Nup133 n=1 Tax=Aspergillus affinis TaxID=1070780 RepID=UPI0022FEBE95|nr:uncharacterized protein KD926_009802 [Aspergillus affinis]KAI9039261.1 hypothetical protein KD926_009802 [Aspergillus affinis]